MSTREQMLAEVRKALGKSSQLSDAQVSEFDPAGIMPALAPEDYPAKFAAEWEKVGGIHHCATTMQELETILKEIAATAAAQTMVLSHSPILAELRIAERLQAAGIAVTAWDNTSASPNSLPEFQAASFQANVGVTGVEYVLAETGSLALTSISEGAMVASLAPPVHVALYRRSQIVGSLDDLLAKLPISSSPDRKTPGRSVVLVTGTSRTADIEQILIRGVHGPGKTHAILVEDSCL